MAVWVAIVAQSSLAAQSVFDITDLGAKSDGHTVNTAAIQSAIDSANEAGGGSVQIPAGVYLTGTLILKSNVTIQLAEGATLLGVADHEQYHDALLCARDTNNIAITGRGTIDGQGDDEQYRITPQNLHAKRRPRLLQFIGCRNVCVEDITLRDSPAWVQHYRDCDDVVIDGITVESHANYNNDMIDVDGCRNVRISNCTGDTGDDAITLKSVVGGPCRNITVTNCVLSSHSNAIKLGTESTGGFENIAITNCAIRPAHTDQFHLGDRRGLAGIALEIVDGGTLDRVTISNIVIEGTTAPIFLRLGDRGRTYPGGPEHPSVGTFRNVVISNVIATGVKNTGCAITGLPDHPIENITLCNINITYAGGGAATSAERTPDEHPNRYPECTMFGELPAYGFYVRHARGVTFDNVRLVCEKPDARPAIACDDVQDLRLANIATNASADATIVQLQDVQNALIRDCFLPTTTRPFLQCDGACRNIIGIDR